MNNLTETYEKEPEMKKNPDNVEKTGSTDKEQRRRAVRNILFAGGSTLAVSQLTTGTWTKPIVNAISLPAHAQWPGVDFNPSDPVFLTYECGGPADQDVVVDIAGYINVPQAGIQVDLELTWDNGILDPLTVSPPLMLSVFTNGEGSFSAPDNNIGYNVYVVEVTASLPDYPGAGPAQDSINPSFQAYPYYCSEEA